DLAITFKELFQLLRVGNPQLGLPVYAGFLFYQSIEEVLRVLENNPEEVQAILRTLFKELQIHQKEILGSMGEIYEELLKLQKRKQKKATGTFYTPKYITQFMTQTLMENWPKEKLDTLKILDPACGTGHFLHKIAFFLKQNGISNEHLLKQIYGVDLDPFAVDIAKFTLWLKYGTQSWDFSPLNHHIKCGNSLLFSSLNDLEDSVQTTLYSSHFKQLLDAIKAQGSIDPILLKQIKILADLKLFLSLEGGKITKSYYDLVRKILEINKSQKEIKSPKFSRKINSMHWELEFPEIFFPYSSSSGFDAIIGNPPYVTEARGNKDLFRELKKVSYLKKTYEKNMDIFSWFTHLSIDLLKEDGYLCFILPAYWAIRSSTSKLRDKIQEKTQIKKIVDFSTLQVFPEAPGHHSHILLLQKSPTLKSQENVQFMNFSDLSKGKYSQQTLEVKKILRQAVFDQYQLYISTNKFVFQPKKVIERIKKMKEGSLFFLSPSTVVRGIDLQPSRHKGSGVFLLTSEELEKLPLNPEEKKIIKPFYRASQLDSYYFDPDNHFWLIYTDQKRKKILEQNSERFPNLINHLSKFKTVITSDNAPFGLHRPKKEENFETIHKILFVRKTPYPKFAYVPIPYFVDESVYIILCENLPVHPYFLLTILNSSLAKEWFAIHKAQGKHLQIDKEIILNFPIPDISFQQEESVRKDVVTNLWETYNGDTNRLIAKIQTWKDHSQDELIHEFLVLLVQNLITKQNSSDLASLTFKTEEIRKLIDKITYTLYDL
ncbi:MAG: Eco57I restriction-modification methylase domain-containing protein, partial [Candidatus Hodarchaeota archaeon]